MVRPALIKPVHIYKYLDGRAAEGAPAKANKEVALLSAVLECGRRREYSRRTHAATSSTTGPVRTHAT